MSCDVFSELFTQDSQHARGDRFATVSTRHEVPTLHSIGVGRGRRSASTYAAVAGRRMSAATASLATKYLFSATAFGLNQCRNEGRPHRQVHQIQILCIS